MKAVHNSRDHLSYGWPRTARKRHFCGGRRTGSCLREIRPSERYLRTAMFPGEFNSSGQPWTAALCPPCAGYYGYPTDQL